MAEKVADFRRFGSRPPAGHRWPEPGVARGFRPRKRARRLSEPLYMVVQERPGTAYQGCGHFLLPIFDVYERELVLTTRHFACLLSITAPSS